MKELVIDVSHWDGDIDLNAWKSRRGCWGVIVKAGGNERGRYKDSTFERNHDKARAAGLHVGAYYYTTVTSVDAAREDARHCLSILGSRFFDLPIYIDVEDPSQPAIGRRRLTDVCLAFMREVESAGHRGGVYTSGSWWQGNVYADELRPYANWIAWWTASKPSAISDVGMWQQGGMRLSDGHVVYDDVGGYVDCNWCYVDYTGGKPSDEGGSMAKLTYPQMAAEVCEHFIDHPVHGYSQIHRDGTGEVETITLSDGTDVSFQSGDRDCSRLMQTCYVVVGALPRGMHMWTGNEREILLDNGFVEVSLDDVERGDVLWRAGHTEMYLGDWTEGGARQSEYGTIDGEPGDQTGEEIARSEYQPWHWESAYRCISVRPGSEDEPEPEPVIPTQPASEPYNDLGLHYRAHVQNAGWLPAVRDGQIAGTVGYSARLEAIKITPPEGVVLDVHFHIQGYGWLAYDNVLKGECSGTDSSENDPIMGTTGESRRAEAVKIHVIQWPDNLAGKHIHLQAHCQGVGWMTPVGESEVCGTTGQSRRLEAVRMWID